MLIERIEINIQGKTEQTEITITWVGGFTSCHHLSRTVTSYSQFTGADELVAHIVELKQTGLNLKQVAAQLNRDGVASLRGPPFTNSMLSRLLTKRGIHLRPARPRPDTVVLERHEWWLPDLADVLKMPRTTLSHWHAIGWVRGRKFPGRRGRIILWADAKELERLQRLRETRRRWSDCPYPKTLTTPQLPPAS
jgi:hypothetical protein